MSQMTTKMYEVLQEACENEGFQTMNYSGRGMMGRRCFGVESDEHPLPMMVKIMGGLSSMIDPERFGRAEFDDLVRLLCSAQQDSLGQGWILYFPQLEVP